MSVQGRRRHPETLGCIGDGNLWVAEKRARGRQIRGLHRGWSATGSALSASCIEPGAGAFADQTALELSQGCEDMEHELASGSRGIDRLRGV